MNSGSHITRRVGASAFTLVELLITLAVLLILSFLLLQTTMTSQDTVTRELRQMDAIGSARIALDTLTEDIGTLVTRGGTTVLFKPGDAVANDTLRFITTCRNSSTNARARMTLVSYSVETRPHPVLEVEVPMLIRGTAPLFWPATSDVMAEDYLLKQLLGEKPMEDSDVAAEHVFRFEITWLHEDGRISRDPRKASLEGTSDPDDAADANGYFWVNLRHIRGFIVGVAALDGAGQQQVVRDAGFAQLQHTLTALSDSETDVGRLPANLWRAQMAQVQPAVARQRLRVLQRTFFLPR